MMGETTSRPNTRTSFSTTWGNSTFYGRKGSYFKIIVSYGYRLIFADEKTRNLFFFLSINFSFAFVELFYGIWTNSLGLISDSCHMFFDCSALIAGLIASVISKWRSNERYTYGYVRAEIMTGFLNGLFLIFIAFFILGEAVEVSCPKNNSTKAKSANKFFD